MYCAFGTVATLAKVFGDAKPLAIQDIRIAASGDAALPLARSTMSVNIRDVKRSLVSHADAQTQGLASFIPGDVFPNIVSTFDDASMWVSDPQRKSVFLDAIEEPAKKKRMLRK